MGNKISTTEILTGNSLHILKTLPDESVNCVITSPPYYGLRDYGTGTWEGGDPNCSHRMERTYRSCSTGHANQHEIGLGMCNEIYKTKCPKCGAIRIDEQIGLEETPEEYIENLVNVFREVKRVLKDDGTVWLNIGDSYASNTHSNNNFNYEGGRGSNNPHIATTNVIKDDVKQKDLIGIPWMLAFALRADGWYLRQDIIWHKPNPMPESVKDRCTKSHEYIFLLSKSPRYYFDNESIKEPTLTYDDRIRNRDETKLNNTPGRTKMGGLKTNNYTERNKRDVWTISTKPFDGAHFATFPEELVIPCLLAGCPEKGTVLDPFAGAGTVGVVCKKNNRNFIGVELNPEYVKIAEKRIEDTPEPKTKLW